MLTVCSTGRASCVAAQMIVLASRSFKSSPYTLPVAFVSAVAAGMGGKSSGSRPSSASVRPSIASRSLLPSRVSVIASSALIARSIFESVAAGTTAAPSASICAPTYALTVTSRSVAVTVSRPFSVASKTFARMGRLDFAGAILASSVTAFSRCSLSTVTSMIPFSFQ